MVGNLARGEPEIVKAVKEPEAMVPAETICRCLNIVRETFCQGKKKCARLDVGVGRLDRLKDPEEENACPKRMWAGAGLDTRIFREGT